MLWAFKNRKFDEETRIITPPSDRLQSCNIIKGRKANMDSKEIVQQAYECFGAGDIGGLAVLMMKIMSGLLMVSWSCPENTMAFQHSWKGHLQKIQRSDPVLI